VVVAAALAACATAPAPIVGADGLRGSRPQHQQPALPYDTDTPPHVADASANIQCVPFARQASGISIYGDANTWWRQAAGRYARSQMPAAGSVLVMRGYRTSARGHVAVVTRVENDRLIIIDQANWLNGGEVSLGVPVLDVSPNNDWSEVRVWHIPGGHWGGRIYGVEGFIHPFQLHAAMG